MIKELQTVIIETKGKIGYITLNRADKMNALSDQLLDDAYFAVKQLDDDDDIRVIVIKANGRSFCAGYDLSPREKPFTTIQDWRGHVRQGNRLMLSIWNSKKPVIGQIHGHCLGGGCDIAMACDFTIAAENASFGEPEIQFNSHCVFNIMPWQIGMKKVKQLLLTGDRIDAVEAERIGLITSAVPADELEVAVDTLAKKLVKIPVPAMRMNKDTINRTYETAGFLTTVRQCEEAFPVVLMTETPESVKFFEVAQEKGLAAAFKWRDALFANEESNE